MAIRRKIYYPDEQIEKNLFTNGREYMFLDNWEEYSGYFHRYSTGEIFTEKNWDHVKSKRLVRFKEGSKSYFKYLDLKQFTILPNGDKRKTIGETTQFYKYRAPRVVKVRPTSKDLKKGKILRYFVYKRNEPERVFFEIDADQVKNYSSLNKGINHILYGLVNITWKVDGPEYDIYSGSILMKPGVHDTNKRIVLRNAKKYPMLAKVVTNFRKYSKYDTGLSHSTGCINCK
jgi:hypothetical protein